MGEIAAIIRQITCSVSFMPLLAERCSFDLLVYTDKDVLVRACVRAWVRAAWVRTSRHAWQPNRNQPRARIHAN